MCIMYKNARTGQSLFIVIKNGDDKDVKKNSSESQGRIFYNGTACKHLNAVFEDFSDVWKCLGQNVKCQRGIQETGMIETGFPGSNVKLQNVQNPLI